MTVTRPALRYFGGKWRIAQWIIQSFPPHDSYIEPFGGGASVLLAKNPSPLETYNDLDGAVVNFFRVLRNQPNDLIRLIEMTPYAKEEYELAKQDTDDPVEAARRFYVKSWQSFGSKARGSGWRRVMDTARGSNPSDDWDNVAHLHQIAKRLKRVQIEHDDAFTVIERFDRPWTLFYVDPPYVRDTRGDKWAYEVEMKDDGHIRLAQVLHGVQGMVVLSGYRSELYHQLYADWQMLTCSTLTNGGDGRREECLWLSPNTIRPMGMLF